MSREELHQKLMDIFWENAVTPNTIWRIESGLTIARASSLHQICIGLGVSLKDILGEVEPESKLVDIVKRIKGWISIFTVRRPKPKSSLPLKRGFLAQELTLLPGGATRSEEDPIEIGKFEKLIYCLSGKVTCVVGTERHILNKGDCLSFQSNLPHYFENKSPARQAV